MKICELFPFVTSRMKNPVNTPCKRKSVKRNKNPIAARRIRNWAARTLKEEIAHDDERGDGLVHPAVFLKEVTYYDASAEQRHEEVDGDHRGVIRRRQHQPLQTLVKLRQQAQLHGRRPPPPSSGPGTKEAKTKQTTKQIREWSGERWLRPPTTPWQMPRPADYFEEVRNIIFVRKCERRGEKEADLGAKTSRQMLRSPIKPREGFQSVIGMAFGGKSSRIPGCSPCSLSLSLSLSSLPLPVYIYFSLSSPAFVSRARRIAFGGQIITCSVFIRYDCVCCFGKWRPGSDTLMASRTSGVPFHTVVESA